MKKMIVSIFLICVVLSGMYGADFCNGGIDPYMFQFGTSRKEIASYWAQNDNVEITKSEVHISNFDYPVNPTKSSLTISDVSYLFNDNGILSGYKFAFQETTERGFLMGYLSGFVTINSLELMDIDVLLKDDNTQFVQLLYISKEYAVVVGHITFDDYGSKSYSLMFNVVKR